MPPNLGLTMNRDEMFDFLDSVNQPMPPNFREIAWMMVRFHDREPIPLSAKRNPPEGDFMPAPASLLSKRSEPFRVISLHLSYEIARHR